MQVQELTLQEMEQVNGGGGLLGLLGKGCKGILKVDADIDLDLDLDIEIC